MSGLRNPSRIRKSELASLREVLGGAADLLLTVAWEVFVCGPPFKTKIYISQQAFNFNFNASAASVKGYRLKLERFGLIRTEFNPGHGYLYEVVDPEGLDMLLSAFGQWNAEREAARQHVGS